MLALFRLTPEGEVLLGRYGPLVRWWHRVSTRQSFVRTQVPPRHVGQSAK
jgi:hypothetical protein